MRKLRTAILISGRGSNMMALVEAARAAEYPAEIVCVVALDAYLRSMNVEAMALAGFMRVLTAGFIAGWDGRLINIHPSLLPAYKGLHTHERAIADGAKVHGCSVHLVTPELDGGPVLLQAEVPVLPEDTADVLAARVLTEEHRIYPQALALLSHRIIAETP